jgi:hypothetical protein
LAITTIPQNIGTGFDKFNAAMLALDQFNSAAQDGKVVGVALPTSKSAPTDEKAKGAAMSEEEIDEWLAGLGLKRTDKNAFAVIEEVKERIEEVKQAQERIVEASSELEEAEPVANQPEEELIDPMSITAEEVESKTEEVHQVTGTDGVKIAITSPEGTEFYKGQARMWKLDIQGYNPGPGASKVCHWTFYLDGVKYREMPDNKGCGFTSTFIEQKGSLRAEVKIDFLQGRSIFDDEGNGEYVQDVVESLNASREYTVI